MSNQIIELAEITLADGKTEADLMNGANEMRAGFLSLQEGFISHDLVRQGDATFADIVRWENAECAQAAMSKAEASPACAKYFSVMKFDPENPHAGVSHFEVLSSI